MTGIDNLTLCLETLNDLSVQLLGHPEDAIHSIRRSGILAPSLPPLPRGETPEERDAVAEVKIGIVTKRKADRDSLQDAIAVLQKCVRDLSKGELPSQRVLGA